MPFRTAVSKSVPIMPKALSPMPKPGVMYQYQAMPKAAPGELGSPMMILSFHLGSSRSFQLANCLGSTCSALTRTELDVGAVDHDELGVVIGEAQVAVEPLRRLDVGAGEVPAHVGQGAGVRQRELGIDAVEQHVGEVLAGRVLVQDLGRHLAAGRRSVVDLDLGVALAEALRQAVGTQRGTFRCPLGAPPRARGGP